MGGLLAHTEGQKKEERETVAPGGVWFQSSTKAGGSISQTRREVVVTGEGGQQIARFPVTVLVPSH